MTSLVPRPYFYIKVTGANITLYKIGPGDEAKVWLDRFFENRPSACITYIHANLSVCARVQMMHFGC